MNATTTAPETDFIAPTPAMLRSTRDILDRLSADPGETCADLAAGLPVHTDAATALRWAARRLGHPTGVATAPAPRPSGHRATTGTVYADDPEPMFLPDGA